MADHELDVRTMRKPDKHPAIFAAYDALAVGESFVLVNNHDPIHLRDEFDRDHPAGYDWEYLQRDPREWRIRIGKRTSTALPRVLCDTAEVTYDDPDAAGAVWALQVADRDLDANVVHLPAGDGIGRHTGPDLDVLIHVVAGSGRLSGEGPTIELRQGQLVWLPRRSERQFAAGPDGLTYLTVHRKRQTMLLDPTNGPSGAAS